MPKPVKLIDILSAQTRKVNLAEENLECDACFGSGEEVVLHPETGHDTTLCRVCLGSGYNQLGLILFNLLKPPPQGYGPVELKTALAEPTIREEQAPGKPVVNTQSNPDRATLKSPTQPSTKNARNYKTERTKAIRGIQPQQTGGA